MRTYKVDAPSAEELTLRAIEMLVDAGFDPMDAGEMGLDKWFNGFDGVIAQDNGDLLVALVHGGDERLELRWMTRRGWETQPPVSLPINAHGARLLTAIARA